MGASVMETINLVVAEDIADEIVKRLACNELPEETGQQIREIAKHGSMRYCHVLGYGPQPFVLDSTFRPDGTLRLIIQDSAGCPVWQTVLKAPPPPPRQVHITHQVTCPHDGIDGDDDR
jgi:hypothetical protein